MQHRAGLLIRNNRDVVVTLPMGRLIHPDMGTYLVLPGATDPAVPRAA